MNNEPNCPDCNHVPHKAGRCLNCGCGESEVIKPLSTTHRLENGRFEFSGLQNEVVVHRGFRVPVRMPIY